DRRVLAVVALDVLDVLGAVTVGLVGQDLLHTLLGLVDVQFGGDEEAGLPEAEHQHHGQDDRRQHTDDGADDGRRLLGALLDTRLRVWGVLAGLTRLAWLSRLGVLAVLRLAGLAVLRLPVLRLAVLS